MPELIIKNGKFYRNGIEEGPEIGSVEQINCLKETNRKNEEAKKSIGVDTDYECTTTGTAEFRCVCGEKVYYEVEFEGTPDDDDCFVGKAKTCRVCGRRYEFEFDADYKLIAKMTK